MVVRILCADNRELVAIGLKMPEQKFSPRFSKVRIGSLGAMFRDLLREHSRIHEQVFPRRSPYVNLVSKAFEFLR